MFNILRSISCPSAAAHGPGTAPPSSIVLCGGFQREPKRGRSSSSSAARATSSSFDAMYRIADDRQELGWATATTMGVHLRRPTTSGSSPRASAAASPNWRVAVFQFLQERSSDGIGYERPQGDVHLPPRRGYATGGRGYTAGGVTQWGYSWGRVL